MNISALILAKNEEDIIADCITQLDFADEIIILDQGSTDKTPEIAKKLGCIVHESNYQNFDQNRNYLKSLAKGKWLLYLDADERINSENIEEIKEVITASEFDAFYFARKNYILGKFLKYGGWYPDYVPRLFKKNKLLGWFGHVHESPKIEGKFGYLKTPINHFTARNFENMFKKTVKWAKIEAELAYRAKHPKVSSLKVAKAVLQEFISRFILKLGILDGYIGTIEAIFQAMHRGIMLVYLWEIQTKSQKQIDQINYE